MSSEEDASDSSDNNISGNESGEQETEEVEEKEDITQEENKFDEKKLILTSEINLNLSQSARKALHCETKSKSVFVLLSQINEDLSNLQDNLAKTFKMPLFKKRRDFDYVSSINYYPSASNKATQTDCKPSYNLKKMEEKGINANLFKETKEFNKYQYPGSQYNYKISSQNSIHNDARELYKNKNHYLLDKAPIVYNKDPIPDRAFISLK